MKGGLLHAKRPPFAELEITVGNWNRKLRFRYSLKLSFAPAITLLRWTLHGMRHTYREHAARRHLLREEIVVEVHREAARQVLHTAGQLLQSVGAGVRLGSRLHETGPELPQHQGRTLNQVGHIHIADGIAIVLQRHLLYIQVLVGLEIDRELSGQGRGQVLSLKRHILHITICTK